MVNLYSTTHLQNIPVVSPHNNLPRRMQHEHMFSGFLTVLRALRPGGGRAILILDNAIHVKRWWHADEAAREVGVVVQTISHLQ